MSGCHNGRLGISTISHIIYAIRKDSLHTGYSVDSLAAKKAVAEVAAKVVAAEGQRLTS